MAGNDAPDRGGPIRIVIVANVRLYREGLAASLGTQQALLVVGTAATRSEAAAHIEAQQPDVVLVDIAMREALAIVRDVRRSSARRRVLAFALGDVTADIIGCAEAGADGYVTADASIRDLAAAVERIARDELVCPPHVTATLFKCVAQGCARPVPSAAGAKTLTSRERQVLDLIRLGQSNKEIAQTLRIAEPTVKNHVHHLLAKLAVTTRAQAAAKIGRAWAGTLR